MSSPSSTIRTIRKINEYGWTADVAIGALLALAVGLYTYLAANGAPLAVAGVKVPASMVWAGVAFVAGFFGSLSLYPFGGGGGS